MPSSSVIMIRFGKLATSSTSPANTVVWPRRVGVNSLILSGINAFNSERYTSIGWPVKYKPSVSFSPLSRTSSDHGLTGLAGLRWTSSTSPNKSIIPVSRFCRACSAACTASGNCAIKLERSMPKQSSAPARITASKVRLLIFFRSIRWQKSNRSV